jgi:hypothetical protein
MEMIYLVKKSGFSVLEHPVTWKDHPESHVNTVSDGINMFAEIFKIRFR